MTSPSQVVVMSVEFFFFSIKIVKFTKFRNFTINPNISYKIKEFKLSNV
jgi:hypothetical protein